MLLLLLLILPLLLLLLLLLILPLLLLLLLILPLVLLLLLRLLLCPCKQCLSPHVCHQRITISVWMQLGRAASRGPNLPHIAEPGRLLHVHERYFAFACSPLIGS